MLHNVDLILTLAGGLSAALVLGFITQKLRMSPIVGYLLAGIIVGPYSPGFVADADTASQCAEIGIILLMFGVGPQEAHFEMNTYDIYKKQLTIQGSFINPLTFKDAISLLESGKMNVAPLISHELGLEEVQDFLDGKIQGVSKAVVKVGE
mgnify:CR=1 FL=1